MTAGVYALLDPQTLEVGYVGISMSIESRHRQHCRHAHSEKLRGWVSSLASAPVLQILHETDDLAKQMELEIQEIERHGLDRLANKMRGGGNGSPRRPMTQVSAKVGIDVAAELQRMAEDDDRTLAYMVAHALIEWLDMNPDRAINGLPL